MRFLDRRSRPCVSNFPDPFHDLARTPWLFQCRFCLARPVLSLASPPPLLYTSCCPPRPRHPMQVHPEIVDETSNRE